MTDQRDVLAPDLIDQILEIRQVIHEVVIAAGTDAIAVAVTAQIGRYKMIFAGKSCGCDRLPCPRQIEKAVDQNHCVIEGRIVAAPL